MHPTLQLENLQFRWHSSGQPLLDINRLNLAAGERLFVAGPSGCGKSTLLSLVAGVLLPERGHVRVLGHDSRMLSGAARDRFRARHIGMIFQMFNLLPWLPVLDNVVLPCRFSRARRRNAERRDGTVEAQARRLLRRLGLDAEEVMAVPVTDLSVGQQQRVAAVRALMGEPEMVIADEPTSSLDTDLRTEFVALLTEQCRETGAALLFVSHDRAFLDAFDRFIELPEINGATMETGL